MPLSVRLKFVGNLSNTPAQHQGGQRDGAHGRRAQLGRCNLILRSVVSNRSPRVTHFTMPGPHTNICMAGV